LNKNLKFEIKNYRIFITFFTKNIPVRTSIERPTNSKYMSVETGKILKIPAETG